MSEEGQDPPPGRGPEPQPPNQASLDQPAPPQPPPSQPPPSQAPPNWGQPPNWGSAPPPYGYPPQPPPYGYPPQPPPPYGHAPPPPYSSVPRTQTEGTAITALVLAIVSFPLSFSCGIGVIAAIVSLALTPSARRKIEASGGTLTGESMLTASKIVAWINIGLTALVLLIIGIGAAAGWWDDDSYDYSLAMALAFAP